MLLISPATFCTAASLALTRFEYSYFSFAHIRNVSHSDPVNSLSLSLSLSLSHSDPVPDAGG
jgi:hypothetical protein